MKYAALDPSSKALTPVAETAGCLSNGHSPLLPYQQTHHFIWQAICLTKTLHSPVGMANGMQTQVVGWGLGAE